MIVQELGRRAADGGSKSLGAESNADLRTAWAAYVDRLAEADTRVVRDAEQYLGVVGQERPRGRLALTHNSRLIFLDLSVMYTGGGATDRKGA